MHTALFVCFPALLRTTGLCSSVFLQDCCAKVFRRQGIAGFYRGVYVNLVRAVPAASIQFAGYELLKSALGVGGGGVSVLGG